MKVKKYFGVRVDWFFVRLALKFEFYFRWVVIMKQLDVLLAWLVLIDIDYISLETYSIS